MTKQIPTEELTDQELADALAAKWIYPEDDEPVVTPPELVEQIRRQRQAKKAGETDASQ